MSISHTPGPWKNLWAQVQRARAAIAKAEGRDQ